MVFGGGDGPLIVDSFNPYPVCLVLFGHGHGRLAIGGWCVVVVVEGSLFSGRCVRAELRLLVCEGEWWMRTAQRSNVLA
eukprot:1621298-Rhodomonas_salina.2